MRLLNFQFKLPGALKIYGLLTGMELSCGPGPQFMSHSALSTSVSCWVMGYFCDQCEDHATPDKGIKMHIVHCHLGNKDVPCQKLF